MVRRVVVEEAYTVLEEKLVEGRFGDVHVIQIRIYSTNATNGMYQRWIDGKFDSTISREEYELTHPPPTQAPRTTGVYLLLHHLKKAAS